MKKVLITSGGTSEKVDQVRSITNRSSGFLGKLIAQKFLANGHFVTYVTTPKSARPKDERNLEIIELDSVSALLETMKTLLVDGEYDYVIHSMAVSDYTAYASMSAEEVAAAVVGLSEAEIVSVLENVSTPNLESKISSESSHLLTFMKRTPKVISYIKEFAPDVKLVGFKLMVDASFEDLRDASAKSFAANGCDLLVANDLREVGHENHHAYLFDADLEFTEAYTKHEISDGIYDALLGDEIED
ncbi:MAG: phosphopantothenate--cysteine ligase [Lactobacillales bacterium]|jgi:phosphopantothenate-cysteine ligase|nr:phosphopantothenate--cysteine ligase [Lactobacillales bacterium]